MRLTPLLLAAAAAFILNGCSPAVSIHPLYTSADLTTDLPLAGAWTEPEGDLWRIAPSGNGFSLTVLHAGDSPATEDFSVHVVRLQGSYFLDVTSKSDSGLAIPGHLFAKVSVEGDELAITLLRDEWLQKNAPSIPGENGQLILTASTAALQRLLLANIDNPGAWEADTTRQHRVP